MTQRTYSVFHLEALVSQSALKKIRVKSRHKTPTSGLPHLCFFTFRKNLIYHSTNTALKDWLTDLRRHNNEATRRQNERIDSWARRNNWVSCASSSQTSREEKQSREFEGGVRPNWCAMLVAILLNQSYASENKGTLQVRDNWNTTCKSFLELQYTLILLSLIILFW